MRVDLRQLVGPRRPGTGPAAGDGGRLRSLPEIGLQFQATQKRQAEGHDPFDEDRADGAPVPVKEPLRRMACRWLASLIIALVAASGSAGVAHGEEGWDKPFPEARYQPYRSPGMFMNDFRFVKVGETYYAFSLQIPRCVGPERIWGDGRSYGVARSKNLLEWQPFGVAACPVRHHWADRGIHSGSVVYDAEKRICYLFYTGVGNTRHGVGLARSGDMESWAMDPDILLEYPDRWLPDARRQAVSADLDGRRYEFLPGGDPYVHPEKVDGFYWMWLQSQVFYGFADHEDGGLLLYRSRELDRGWEFDRIVFAPSIYERFEVPFVWRHGERYYLYVGGVFEDVNKAPTERRDRLAAVDPWLVDPRKPRQSVNLLFEAADIRGPWKPVPGGPIMKYPDHPWNPHYYVWNVLHGPDGRDHVFGWSGDTLGKPYPLGYGSDGAVTIGAPLDRWPP